MGVCFSVKLQAINMQFKFQKFTEKENRALIFCRVFGEILQKNFFTEQFWVIFSLIPIKPHWNFMFDVNHMFDVYFV